MLSVEEVWRRGENKRKEKSEGYYEVKSEGCARVRLGAPDAEEKRTLDAEEKRTLDDLDDEVEDVFSCSNNHRMCMHSVPFAPARCSPG